MNTLHSRHNVNGNEVEIYYRKEGGYTIVGWKAEGYGGNFAKVMSDISPGDEYFDEHVQVMLDNAANSL